MLTKEQIDQAVQDIVPDVLRGLKNELRDRALGIARDAALDVVRKEVAAWATENLVPAVRDSLIESKDGIVAVAPTVAKSLVDVLATAMTAELKKKLESSWERKKILEAMFA